MTRSVATMAVACLAMVLVGMLLWVWNLRTSPLEAPTIEHPEALELTQL